MSYSRPTLPDTFLEGSALDRALYGMGVMVSADRRERNPNIEDTLISAIRGHFVRGEGRVLALATDWIEVQSERINVDRLTRAVEALSKDENLPITIYFTALAQWLARSDRRFERLARLYNGDRLTFLSLAHEPSSFDPTDLLIKKDGEDSRFLGTCLKVAEGTIRRRPLKDILPAKDLCGLHAPFRFRVMIGPTYRADLWALYHEDPGLSAYEAAKRTYSSYETARQVKQDFDLLSRRKGGKAA